MKRIAVLFFVALNGAVAVAADWPQFLGPSRNGVAAPSEPALPDSFQTEPKVIWTQSVGEGHSGPVVAEGRVVLAHRQGSEVLIQAWSPEGNDLWETRIPTSYRDGFGMDNGPRAVPTVSNGRVFYHGADGTFAAFDLKSGKVLWMVDTATSQKSPQGFFGRACAPLVADGKVIVTTGGTSAVTAFDEQSGEVVWSSGEDEASYASPVMLSDTVMLAWLRNRLTTLRVSDGKVLATEDWRPEIDASVSAATPIRTDAGWFISAEYDLGCSLWEVSAEGTMKRLWQEDGLLNAHYATPVHKAGYVYGFDGRQERGMTLRCLSLQDKKLKWESPEVPGGTILLIGDKLLVLTEGGELWIVKASPEKFDQLASVQILRSGHRSHAAYSDGVYYARDGQTLVAVRVVGR